MTKVNKSSFDLYKDGTMRDMFYAIGKTFATEEKKIFILVHDAQNVFDDIYASYQKGWNIVSVLEHLGINNYLVAGLRSFNGIARIREYSPVPNRIGLEREKGLENLHDFPIGGQFYISALIGNLIPYLEEVFNFDFKLSQNIMLGSSMGGVITTYAAKTYPQLFQTYLAFSNAFYANDPEIYHLIEKDASIGRYYHDMGGKEISGAIASESHYIAGFNRMNAYLLRVQANFMSVFDSQAEHDERA